MKTARVHPTLAAGVLVFAAAAAAHIPVVRGRLVELVGAADLIVIATIEPATRHARIEGILLGRPPGRAPFDSIRIDGGPTLAAGSRQVLFLRRAGAAWHCVQPPGVVFPAPPDDDALYQSTVRAVADAPRAGGAGAARLRAALLPALRARATPLRYHAALEIHRLNATAPPSSLEASALEEIARDARTDPALRSLLDPFPREFDAPRH